MSTVSEQVAAARASVLLVFEPELSVAVVTGEDRAKWLNGLVTCDVLKLERGRAQYGLAVTQKGRIVTDLFLVDDDGERLLVVLPSRVRDDVVAMLDHHLIMEDAELAKDEGVRVAFAHGPRAPELLAAARSGAGAVGAACDPTGLGGALLVVGTGDEAAAKLAGVARELGGVVGDAQGWEALRLERGVPRFGVDFDDKTYPQEAALEKRAVSFDKGCYLGQEVVCMLELRGRVKRKLVAVVLDAQADAQAGAPVLDAAGNEVGTLSSVGASPTLARRVGLAMLRLASAAPGTRLRVAGASAEVVERPA
jgi:folate-binding protein YgfZ